MGEKEIKMKGLTKAVKKHCRECNGNSIYEDCQGYNCPLYEFFKILVYKPKVAKAIVE